MQANLPTRRVARWGSAPPDLARCAGIGGAAAAVVGGIVGLIVGLNVYPATAAFAMFELGLPAGVAGMLVGLVVGLVASGLHRVRNVASGRRAGGREQRG